MELIALDANFNILAYITYINLQWWTRYYNFSEMSVLMAADEYSENIAYIMRSDTEQICYAHKVQNAQFDKLGLVQLSGYSLEYVLVDKVIYPIYRGNGTREEIARNLVTTYKGNLDIVLGNVSNINQSSIYLQDMGSEIGIKLYEMLKTDEMSFRVTRDFDKKRFVFTVFKGKERTQSQTENSYITFADTYGNMQNTEVCIDRSNFKNYAIVVGNGAYEDGNQVSVVVGREGTFESMDVTNIYGNSYLEVNGTVSPNNLGVLKSIGDNGYVEIKNTQGNEVRTSQVALVQPLRKIGNYRDYTSKENGKYYFNRCIAYRKYTGSGVSFSYHGEHNFVMQGSKEEKVYNSGIAKVNWLISNIWYTKTEGNLAEGYTYYCYYLDSFDGKWTSDKIQEMVEAIKGDGIDIDAEINAYNNDDGINVAKVKYTRAFGVINDANVLSNAKEQYFNICSIPFYQYTDETNVYKYKNTINLMFPENVGITGKDCYWLGNDKKLHLNISKTTYGNLIDEEDPLTKENAIYTWLESHNMELYYVQDNVKTFCDDQSAFTILNLFDGINIITSQAEIIFEYNGNLYNNRNNTFTVNLYSEYAKQLYVDATNIKYDPNSQTLEEFKNGLLQRGLEALTEHNEIQSLEFDADESFYEYKVDYDIGDVCDIIIDTLKKSYKTRIIEIYEIFKDNKKTIKLNFGDKIPTVYQKARLL